jgi:hypothetical protein
MLHTSLPTASLSATILRPPTTTVLLPRMDGIDLCIREAKVLLATLG